MDAPPRHLPPVDRFTDEQRAILGRYFTDLDGPVFALVNLPEVVKGALFARYSRSGKSLRRLFLDEFYEAGAEPVAALPSARRAEALFAKVFDEYGDDSVAQLGGVHVACEGVSNLLTKALEWGRLLSYLEQSTRYVPYDDRPGGAYRYHLPAELYDHPLALRYRADLDHAFATYARWLAPLGDHLAARFPRRPEENEGAYRRAIRAKALDLLRGLLPAATRSNLGIFGSPQGFEALLLRLAAHPLVEMQTYGRLILEQLRQVVPALLTRVDHPARGGTWSRYLADNRARTAALAARLLAGSGAEARDEVVLTDFDPEGELKVAAAALYAVTDLPDDQLLAAVRQMSETERRELLAAYVGDRTNRRHKPGRAFERTVYRFDILADYGAFRDLQRHRLLTLEWQTLSPRHGQRIPDEIDESGAGADWREVMDRGAALHDAIVAAGLPEVAPYAVPMAYRVRFYLELNAREAMHLLELRSGPQGHPSYRRIAQSMHRLIAERAGHRSLAAAMRFVDHSDVDLERRQSEQLLEAKRQRQAADRRPEE